MNNTIYFNGPTIVYQYKINEEYNKMSDQLEEEVFKQHEDEIF